MARVSVKKLPGDRGQGERQGWNTMQENIVCLVFEAQTSL
jgi:hypothetical protein